jgi:hypothetical protein
MKTLIFNELLNENPRAKAWDLLVAYPITKEEFLNEMDLLKKDKIILFSKHIFLLGSKTSFKKLIKFIPGPCARGLKENQIEEGKIYRFLGGDPIEFVAKVLGETKISGFTFLVLKLSGGNKVFSLKPKREYEFLQLSENQENLPKRIE